MNKTMLILAIAGAFLIGTSMTFLYTENVAFATHKITHNPGGGTEEIDPTLIQKIMRFSDGRGGSVSVNGLFINDGTTYNLQDAEIASSVVGVNGTTTKFHYQTGSAIQNAAFVITATLYKNGQQTNVFCEVPAFMTSCESTVPLAVLSTDIVGVSDDLTQSDGATSAHVDWRKAFVSITPDT